LGLLGSDDLLGSGRLFSWLGFRSLFTNFLLGLLFLVFGFRLRRLELFGLSNEALVELGVDF
jgi:hypothetical protein